LYTFSISQTDTIAQILTVNLIGTACSMWQVACEYRLWPGSKHIFRRDWPSWWLLRNHYYYLLITRGSNITGGDGNEPRLTAYCSVQILTIGWVLVLHVGVEICRSHYLERWYTAS
jgi:hypothetical protein